MSWLSLLLTLKISATTLLVALPFLFASKPLLEKFTGLQARQPMFFRLYGVAITALLVGYGFGIPVAERGEFPWGVTWMGLVSNGAAAALLLAHARSNTVNRLSGIFFGLIALGLALAMSAPAGALSKAW